MCTKQCRTGRLEPIGRHKLGIASYEYSRCVDCGADFPHAAGTRETAYAVCNGAPLSLCPYCRPDSKPFCRGRGL